MGNAESQPLNLNSDQLSDANDGTLFASFGDVLEDLGEMKDCSDAFEELARLRRGDNGAPIDIRRLAEVCCEAWDNKVEENARKIWLRRKAEDLFSVISEATGMGSTIDEPQGRNTENLSKVQKKAADNIVTMFGVRGKHKKTRAHLLPNSRACNIFWGVVSDALSGIDMSTFSKEKKLFVRSEMARILARFKLDLFAFAEPHNSFYDLLEDGLCVMIIPLLTPEQIAEWKQGDKYKVLIFCRSKEAYKRLGTWRKSDNLNHMKWEDDGDLGLAIDVLTAHDVKALADSLNIHWDCYLNQVHSNHKEFPVKKEHMTQAHDDLINNNLQVEVPQKKKIYHLFGRAGRSCSRLI